MGSLSGSATLSTHTANPRALLAGFLSSGVWRFGTTYTSSRASFSCFWSLALKHPSNGNLLRLGPTSAFFAGVKVWEGSLSSRLLGMTVTSAPVSTLNVVRHPSMYSSTFQGSLLYLPAEWLQGRLLCQTCFLC